MQGGVSENDVEQAALNWLSALGWQVGHGPDISPPDARTPGTERDSYREVVLKHRLRDAIRRLLANPNDKAADAVVSSGNTGALTAMAHFVLKCIAAVELAE